MSPTSATPFLSQRVTLQSLSDLVAGDGLNIYCGAGVTIGHTGLGWKKLIAEISSSPLAHRRRKTKNEAFSRIFDSPTVPPDHLASMVVADVKHDGKFSDLELEGYVANRIADALYRENKWNRGTVVGNITRLAVYMAIVGQPVRILTTNYDTHIEKSFEKLINYLQDIALEFSDENNPIWPGLSWRTPGPNGQSETIHEANNTTETIEIIYLHGRVADDGRTFGRVVLSEIDYADTADFVKSELIDHLTTPNENLLIVGASLTDPPLVRSLAETRESANFRCALLPLPTEFANLDQPVQNEVRKISDGRGHLLGVTVLRPETYGQVAQFCEEASIAFFHDRILGSPGTYKQKRHGVRYGQRLSYWWPTWSASHTRSDIARDYRIMKNGLDLAESFVGSQRTGESMRLELWIRRDEDLRARAITLWASSMGPIVERTFLRTERILADSPNASVQALRAGKPILTDLQELGLSRSASRWQSFLSVPILVQVNPKGKLGGKVPTGVMTLASSFPLETTALATALPDEIKQLVDYLIASGREILSLEQLDVND